MAKLRTFSWKAFLLVAQEMSNPFKHPQKPTDGCPSGTYRKGRKGKCVKNK